MLKKLASLLIFLAVLAPLSAGAYSNPGKPVGFVNDFAGVLSGEQRQILEGKLSEFEKETSNEISVAVISGLQGDTIENFAVKLFEEWGVGKKDKDK